ncbi:unnamed protein product [Oikopleura dioica]|uniref:Sialin n=1 Tax=Oikopleura dioica TaxID=34765 RepID=E4Y5K1_OIKDI|nr:unnamed protein product [Oikopleura dioica]
MEENLSEFINSEQEEKYDPPIWKLKRYQNAFLVFWGFAAVYALRVNLSVAIVQMVPPVKNSTKVDYSTPNDPTYDWTPDQQGVILGSFFYGYITTQVLGGYLADRFGAKILLGVGIGCTAFLTIITRQMADAGFAAMVALRVLEGIGEGVTFPAAASFWGKWAPPNERARLAGFSFSGAQFGTIISMPLSGWLCQTVGWSAMFYIFGSISLIWVVLWFWLAANSPEESKTIDAKREFIISQIPPPKEDHSVPWKNIFCCLPFWGILLTHTCYNWTFYAFLTCLPKYLNNVHGFDISSAGIIGALPYICMFLCIVVQGNLSDRLLEKKIMSRTAVRRVFNSIGTILPAIVLPFITVLGCNKDGVVALICISVGFCGFVFSGYNTPNHGDLSPRFSGALFGITNTVGTIPVNGFLAPQVLLLITGDNSSSVDAWSPVWYISMAINLFGSICYMLTASGNLQPWDKGPMLLKDQWEFEKKLFCFKEVEDDREEILDSGEENPYFE